MAINLENQSQFALQTDLIVDGGIATAGGNTTLTDSTKAWQSNEHAGRIVKIIFGTGTGQEKAIVSNTATALTVGSAWATNPDSSSQYIILGIPRMNVGSETVGVTFSAGSFASAAAWLSPSFSVVKNGIYYVTMEVATPCVPQITIDGTNYYNLYGGASINSGSLYTIPVLLRNGDTLNFAQASGSAVTVNILRVDF